METNNGSVELPQVGDLFSWGGITCKVVAMFAATVSNPGGVRYEEVGGAGRKFSCHSLTWMDRVLSGMVKKLAARRMADTADGIAFFGR